MFDSVVSLLIAALIFLAAFGLGRPLLRALRLNVADDDSLAVVAYSLGLGLIAAGLLLTALGMLGLLYRTLIVVLTVIAAYWAAVEMLEQRKRSMDGWTPPTRFGPDDVPEPAVWLGRGLLATAALAAGAALVSALAPPTAGDALCYHLELPKRFLLEHRLVYLPDSDNSTFPLLMEMWYLWALALGGGVAAQLVHWGLGLLLALATALLARPLIGASWAPLAGCLVLLVPGVNNQMAAPLNDVGLAALAALALAAWWQALADEGHRRWYVLAGVFFGGALGTKYVGLILVAAVAVVWLALAMRAPQRRRAWLQGAACMTAMAVAVGGIWYVRAELYRGNPVYPFFQELGGDGDFTTLRESKAPLGHSPLALVAAPWQMTMHPEQFGGRGHQLGALFLVCLPGLLVFRRLRGLRTLLAIAAVDAALCLLLRQNVRFLFPIIPLLAVGVVWCWIEMLRLPGKACHVAMGVVAALVLFSALIPLVRVRHVWTVALGAESRKAWLFQHEPTFAVANWANALLPVDAHLFSQEHRAFYFQRRFTRENIFRRRTRYDQHLADPRQLNNMLRSEGFTHLLLCDTCDSGGVQYDDTLSRLVAAQTVADPDGAPVLLQEYRHREPDGLVRHYRLMLLR